MVYTASSQRPIELGTLEEWGLSPAKKGCIGPLSPTLSGIELFMKTYLDTRPWIKENYLVPLPWRDVELPNRLKIGIMCSDGIVKPHPPILRALSMVVKSLKSADFKVPDWQPKEHDECWKLTSALYYEDGGRRLREMLKAGDEEALPLTAWLLDQEELKANRNAYRSMYNQHWLDTGKDDGHPVDAILCPVGPGCAPPHDQAKYWNHTSQWNLLEYPAISFPVTRVGAELDVPDDTYVPLNEDDRFNHGLYTGPERYKDAPVSLQFVTGRYEDEKCIAILKRIEEVLDKQSN
ncbi:amidase signature enzyme [Fusarium albosuccineum]|uniref:Amidase signature enzyme n=1 Tax=Fusarium albosuccineum TaxID=1237068 RepID=A0A8H4L2B1_9HYPO|nr:amidase signature enzyme [Fusarium albosuccineum]